MREIGVGNAHGKSAKRQSQRLGRAGEAFAAVYLQEKGYRVIARNWTGDQGEIDLVAFADCSSCLLVFCEVKTRHGTEWGYPTEAVGYQKQRRLRLVAREFLMREQPRTNEVRFDVIGIVVGGGVLEIEHLENAF